MNRSLTTKQPARNVRADALVAQMHGAERATLAQAIEEHAVAELERAAIAARIKQARKEAGLSQPEMAEALDVIPRTYQNYESQKDPRTPWGLMNKIAAVTGKTTEWLIHGDRATLDPSARAEPTEMILGRLEQALADALDDRGDHNRRAAEQADKIMDLLSQQGEILERIEGAMRRLGAAEDELIEGLGEKLRDVLIQTAPPSEPPSRT